MISIDFVLDFPQSDLDVHVFMGVPLGMVVDEYIWECVLKLKNQSIESIYQV